MYEYWHDYIKPNYGDNVKICYMDTDNLIVHVKLEDVYADLQKIFREDLTHQTMKSLHR